MSNEDRFWEASIAEAVSGQEPPDQTAEIFARLSAKRKRAPLHPLIRIPLELATAAAVIIAMGLATGIIPWPGKQETTPDPQRRWAVGPGSDVRETDSGLELAKGWLLLKPGAPDVQSGAGSLTKIEGLMLAHAGNQPTEAELNEVADWLKKNQLEEAMFKGKTWAQGLTLAVLVFAGTALLDGQKVEAPEQEAATEPVWHIVRSVMDIDNLPEGVTHVRANRLSAAYLEFFAEVKSLRAIEFRGARDMHSRYLQSLKGLPELRHLDLRDCIVPRPRRWDSDWSKSIDISVLLEFPKLEFLGTMISLELDLRQALPWDSDLGDAPPRQIDVLKQLGDRGVLISLGTSSYPEHVLDVVAEFIPGLHSIGLRGAGDVQLRALRNFAQLRGLELVSGNATELGYAYLARNLKLTELRMIDGKLSPAIFHHISRMKDLTSLELAASGDVLSPEALGKLGALRKLRHLSLWGIPSEILNRSDGRWKDDLAAAMRALPPLKTLKLIGDYGYDEFYPHLFEVLSHASAETVQLDLEEGDFPYVFENSDYSEAVQKPDGPRGPAALRLSLYVSDSEGWDGDPYFFRAALAQFANLKTFTLSITSTRLAMANFEIEKFRSAMPEGVKLEVVFDN